MDEAAKKKRRAQRGQAIVEYVLILALALFFTRFVYFNKTYGFKASLDKMMLSLGSYLEQNLKSGTKKDVVGTSNMDVFGGPGDWKN